jgi:hypothetical protein
MQKEQVVLREPNASDQKTTEQLLLDRLHPGC